MGVVDSTPSLEHGGPNEKAARRVGYPSLRRAASVSRVIWLPQAHMLVLSARIITREGEQSHVAGTLDRYGQRPLMLGTRAVLASRFDFATFTDVAAKSSEVLVIDMLDVIDVEDRDLAA